MYERRALCYYVVPKSNRATDVANEIISVLKVSIVTLQTIACGGKNDNTGKNNSILRKIEKWLERQLQGLVCQFHMNELPILNCFSYVDGRQTPGPATSSGVIAKAIMFDPRKLLTFFTLLERQSMFLMRSVKISAQIRYIF